MAKKHYLAPASETDVDQDPSSLPIDRPVAVYYRQSTAAQVGNISTAIQTVDMAAYLIQRGWAEQDVIMVDMDAGISGTTKIDERPGMSKLFELITEGHIGAVACQDEDRLFRDVTQIQVNIFIEACRSANVKVLTPSMVYDFAHELTGNFHARQFRFKSEMAAEYISTVIIGKLHRAKRRLQLEGRWTGANLLPGYMIDMRKTLPDGSKNENCRRYVPFEPYAEVIREYFRLFVAYSGNLTATSRHIHQHGPFYPDPNVCRPPDGYKVAYQIYHHRNGYCPTAQSLSYLLSNAAYIGHWAVKSVIVRWNNHSPIVPLELFVCAYNYLMPYTLEGKPNPDYRPFCVNARPTLEEHRPRERPLCAGLMYTQLHGKWRKVGTRWQSSKQAYQYVLMGNDVVERCIWSKLASLVDDALAALVYQKLSVTFNSESWDQALATFSKDVKREHTIKQSQVQVLERVMDNLIASLETLTNPEMIRKAQQRYEEAQAEHARLTQGIAEMQQETKRLEALYSLREKYSTVLAEWETLDLKDKRRIFHLFIRRIEAEHFGFGALRLLVHWLDNSIDELMLNKFGPTGENWLPTDVTHLLQMIDANASQVEICQAFPTRTWKTIASKIFRERGAEAFPPGGKLIRAAERYEDYLARIRKNPTSGKSERWTQEEIQSLLSLLEKQADPLELAAAFPRRTWYAIRTKIRKLVGDTFYVRRVSTIREHETIQMYRKRVGLDINTEDNDSLNSTSDTSSFTDC